MTTDQIKSSLHGQIDGLTFDEAHSLWSALDEHCQGSLVFVREITRKMESSLQQLDDAHAREHEQFEDIAMLRKKLAAGWVK